MILDKREHTVVDLPKQIEFAFNILNYNQGLIQFADGKANGLLLINSIFIAAIGPFIEVIRKGGSPLGFILLLVFFVSSITSILLALGVITTRKAAEEKHERSLVFFGGVIQSNSPEGYIHEFSNVEAKRFLEALLTNIFVVSKIASGKYAIYAFAQALTLISCIFWIFNIVYLMVH
ncbi:MAG: Pycsar system effector family protein [Candidatus Ozemobacteraceae bacterium]